MVRAADESHWTMKDNSILRAVREGRAALGTGLKEFASRGVPWIIEASGFDYCMIDHEHGAFDLETIADLAGWFQATDVSAIVRIHKSFTHLIPAILDQGIMGIQVSEVDSVEEARAIVREAKYPPIGNRGISGQGMHTGYRSHGARHATDYAPWANANIIVCVSIESLEGLENVEAIAAVEGIDMVAYGHSDLSARLGVHLGRDRHCARTHFARSLGHLVPHRNGAGDRDASSAPIGKKSKRRLRADFRLAHHVGKNFDGRTGALLPAQAEDGDDRNASQQKNEEEAAEHI